MQAVGDPPPFTKFGQTCGDGKVYDLPVARIHPSPRAPRQILDETELARLAESLRRHGPLQPVLVRPVPDGCYELVFGLRRYHAARVAGLQCLPAVIWEGGSDDAAVLALVENLARENLHPLDEARALDALRLRQGLSTRALAALVGKSHSYVAQRLRWLHDEAVVEGLARGLAPSCAIELMAIADPARRHALLADLLDGRMGFLELQEVRRAPTLLPTAATAEPSARTVSVDDHSPQHTATEAEDDAVADAFTAAPLPGIRTRLQRMLRLTKEFDDQTLLADQLLGLARGLVTELESATATPPGGDVPRPPAAARGWRPTQVIRCGDCSVLVGPGHLSVEAYPSATEGVWLCGTCATWARRRAAREGRRAGAASTT